MGRAYGANSTLLLKKETTYGVAATGNYQKMRFNSCDLGSQQDLIDSPVLGQGRDPAAPTLDIINDDGTIVVPVDMRLLGFWLTGLFGVPDSTQVKATGTITFSANPTAAHTITLNGVTYTFQAGASSGTGVQIKGTLSLTLDELVTILNASASGSINIATYAKDAGATMLEIEFDTAGTTGNAYTLASGNANGVVSGATLTGGGYEHVFTSGGDTLPSYSVEVGKPDVPSFDLHTGVMIGAIAFDFQRSGLAAATVNVSAQDETVYTSSQGGTPTDSISFTPASQFKGSLKSGGDFVGNLTGLKFTYNNTLEKIQTIRDDARIDGIDPTVSTLSGSFDMRFAGNDFFDDAIDGTAIDLEAAYTVAAGLKLTMAMHEAYLSRPKKPISGPGGIQSTFEFRGAKNSVAGCMMTVTLLNDLDGTQYA